MSASVPSAPEGFGGRWNQNYLVGAVAGTAIGGAALVGFALALSARVPVYSYRSYAEGIFLGLFGAVSAALAFRFWLRARPQQAPPRAGEDRWRAYASLAPAILLMTQFYFFVRMLGENATLNGGTDSSLFGIFGVVVLCSAAGAVVAFLESVEIAKGAPARRYRAFIDAGSAIYLAIALLVAWSLIQIAARLAGA